MSVNETVPLDEIQSVEASEPVHIARTHEKYMASMVSSMQNGIEKTNELILKLVKSIEGNSASCSQRLNPTKTGINLPQRGQNAPQSQGNKVVAMTTTM